MARGVHEAEVPTPADPEDVDGTEIEGAPHALHVLDQLVLRALLDGHPLGPPVPPVVPEDETPREGSRERSERADQAAGIGAGAAVGDEARGPVPHDLRVEGRSVDRELHVPS